MKLRAFLIAIFLNISLFSSEPQFYCAPELYPVLEKVQRLPEASEVIDQVLEQGPLSIVLNEDYPDDFIGYWSSYDRTIHISKTGTASECTLVTALLMELHNALRNDEIVHMHCQASQGCIDRDQYIIDFEAIEHRNALDAKHLISLGSQRGIFPSNCRFNIAEDFDKHLEIQRDAGHSQWVGRSYDYFCKIGSDPA